MSEFIDVEKFWPLFGQVTFVLIAPFLGDSSHVKKQRYLLSVCASPGLHVAVSLGSRLLPL